MNKPDIKKIIWDLDNTPWDWVKGAAKIYPAMHHTLVRETGLSRERVLECMRNFYGRAGTLESSWLVQDLDKQGLFEGLDLDRDHLIRQVRRAFHASRQKHLTLFEGFPELFDRAIQNDVRNLIVTDAPACHAASRIRHFDLDRGYFDHMYAMQDSLPGDVPPAFYSKYAGGRYGLSFPVTLLEHEKPHTDLTALLGMDEEELAAHAAVVGDNYNKDMTLSARYGMLGIHARWGRASREYMRIISEFSDGRAAERNVSLSAQETAFPNVIPADHPRDIPAILGWR